MDKPSFIVLIMLIAFSAMLFKEEYLETPKVILTPVYTIIRDKNYIKVYLGKDLNKLVELKHGDTLTVGGK